MKKSRKVLIIFIVILFVVFILPYMRVIFLTTFCGKELAYTDLSAYADEIYDYKIYYYYKNIYAQVLYIVGDKEYGVDVYKRQDRF